MIIMKFGLLARRDSCASVGLVVDRLMTHLLFVVLVVVLVVLMAVVLLVITSCIAVVTVVDVV